MSSLHTYEEVIELLQIDIKFFNKKEKKKQKLSNLFKIHPFRETCDHENEHHNSRNDEHAEAEHHDLCPSALIKLNVEPQCSSDEVLWHFCAHSCNCDSNLADYPHAMVRKFKCEEFKDILGQIGEIRFQKKSLFFLLRIPRQIEQA